VNYHVGDDRQYSFVAGRIGFKWIAIGGLMTAKANSVRQDIFRLQTHYQLEALIERAKDEGLAEDEAIEALERAIEEMRDFRERARDAIVSGRLF
jgi:hypothetical protein